MKSTLFYLLVFSFSQIAFAFTAEVRTSPATVKSSVFGIVVANDKRSSSDSEQTDRAAMLIVIGNPKESHSQIRYKKLLELFNQYYDQSSGGGY